MPRALLIAALTLCAAGCKGSANSGPTGGTGSGTAIAGACGEMAETVRALYRTESTGNPELDADLLDANVHMILTDCSTDPDKYTACIRRASTVDDLERDCLIPIDDEGAVEGRRFSN
jgi:hypothetical protein